MSAIPVLPLTRANLPALREHFLSLSKDDVRLRFGHMLPAEGVLAYVDHIVFDRDIVYGVFDANLALAGVAHLGLMERAAEFGVSVVPERRRRGIGTALFQRASAYASNHGLRQFFMHCLSENAPMVRIARRAGMEIVTEAGEVDAHVALPPGDAQTQAHELLLDRVALFDFALKAQMAAARALMTEASAIAGEDDAGQG